MSVEQPTYSIYNTDKDPTNFLLNGVMELLDSFDKAQTLKKLNAGREQKVVSGERGCGTPPLGYQWNYTSGIGVFLYR